MKRLGKVGVRPGRDPVKVERSRAASAGDRRAAPAKSDGQSDTDLDFLDGTGGALDRVAELPQEVLLRYCGPSPRHTDVSRPRNK